MIKIHPTQDTLWREGHTVGASDDDLEASTPLAFVLYLLCYHWGAPKRALEVGQARGVGAVHSIGSHGRITLNVHIERLAAIGLVTKRCASKCVEGFQSVKTHVFGCAERSVQVLKGERIAIRRGSIGECLRKNVNETLHFCAAVYLQQARRML